MLYNPFQSRTSRSYETEHPLASVIHSRALTKLQLHKPSNLVSGIARELSPRSNKLANLQHHDNPFSHRTITENQCITHLRDNPFVCEIPVRYQPIYYQQFTTKQLSPWEKRTILDKYRHEQAIDVRNFAQQQSNWNSKIPNQPYQKSIKSKIKNNSSQQVNQEKNRRVQQILKEVYANDITASKANYNESKVEGYNSSKNAINNRWSFRQQVSRDSSGMKNYGVQQYSIINRLRQYKPEEPILRNTDSRIDKYQLAIKHSQKNQEFAGDSSNSQIDELKQQLYKTSKFNPCEKPSSISYQNKIYQLVSL